MEDTEPFEQGMDTAGMDTAVDTAFEVRDVPVWLSADVQTPMHLSPFFGSCLLHVVFVVLLVIVPDYFSEEQPRRFVNHHFQLLVLTSPEKLINPPMPVYYSAEKRKDVPAAVVSRQKSATTGSKPLPGLPTALPVPSTLIQPDVPPEIAAPAVRVPEVLVWAQKKATTSRVIVGLAAPVKSPVPVPEPSFELPPALSAAAVSRPRNEESEGRLISVSAIPLPPEGRIAVPLVTQTVGGQTFGVQIARGESGRSQTEASGESTGGSGVGESASKNVLGGTDKAGSEGSEPHGASPANGIAAAPPLPSVERAKEGTASGTRISRPQNGRHSAVVTGTRASAAYPESIGVLTGKIVYTVYLQVGLRKSWILQFCLPAEAERGRAAGTSAAVLEAPWPYTIVRPTTEGLAGDYTLVRGAVDVKGHFDQLSLVMPAAGPATPLLEALREWEFRPALRDGSPAQVEILLIVPHPQE